jgi:hypothetical protein
MAILNFKQFSILESNLIDIGKILKIEFNDKWGEHIITCQLVEYLWGVDRSKLAYRFRVIETDTNHYPVGGEMILPIHFNNNTITFLFYPYYNEKPGYRSMTELNYKADCKIL